jgi:hypothetical protein
MSRPIVRVQQEDERGCVLATVAALTGRTYASVASEVRERFGDETRGKEHGLIWFDALNLLAEAGFIYQVRQKFAFNRPREPWPPEPWAPLHYCSVDTPTMAHAVAMLADGSVLDPSTPAPRRLTDYVDVSAVIGLWLSPERA